MNVRSIMESVFYSEWAILRYSPEPKLGRISILWKQQGRGAPLGRALVHQVRGWYSGVAIKMGRRQGATREHI
jgi:hypothetical protein